MNKPNKAPCAPTIIGQWDVEIDTCGTPHDPVSPSHYKEGRKYETWDVIIDWGLDYCLGNVVKYISRAGRKGDKLEDLRKAKAYIERAIVAEEDRRND